MAEIGIDIEKAKALLDKGELVGIPTETVYGLAGNALNPDSVAKIFEVKNRPRFDPLIVHFGSIEMVSAYTTQIAEPLLKLAEKFWPGPLTLILPRQPAIGDLVTSGMETVAVRIPNHQLTRALLSTLDFPLAAPSANPFGYISPTRAIHVNDQLGKEIQYILDGGTCEVGLESTIVGMEEDQVIIYRLGGLEISAIEKIVGRLVVTSHSSSNPKSPGMLKSHYAPTKPLIVGNLDDLVEKYSSQGTKFGVLSFEKTFPQILDYKQFVLSPSGDLHEAAKNLFSGLRILDRLDVSVILAELLPENGLGRAINDRLKRAASH